MIKTDGRILISTHLGADLYRLMVEVPDIAAAAQPGQFVHIRVGRSTVPLLRRPLSIHAVNGRSIELLYKVVGEGTRLLPEMEEGDQMDLIGPLGRGFVIEEVDGYLLVGGGVGIAPLFYLSQVLRARGVSVTVLYGASTAEALVRCEELESMGVNVSVTTDDGSVGRRGLVTDLLEDWLADRGDRDREHLRICASGPVGMLRRISDLIIPLGIPLEISVEERMACGVGACLGCAIPARAGGYLQVCTDGPVFDARDVVFPQQ